jgi:hypothetical protein
MEEIYTFEYTNDIIPVDNNEFFPWDASLHTRLFKIQYSSLLEHWKERGKILSKDNEMLQKSYNEALEKLTEFEILIKLSKE